MLLINPYIFPGLITDRKADTDMLSAYLSGRNIKSRRREVVYGRYAIGYILRMECKYSFSEIGRLLGIDHATVMYGCRMISESKQYNKELHEKYRHTRLEMIRRGII